MKDDKQLEKEHKKHREDAPVPDPAPVSAFDSEKPPPDGLPPDTV